MYLLKILPFHSFDLLSLSSPFPSSFSSHPTLPYLTLLVTLRHYYSDPAQTPSLLPSLPTLTILPSPSLPSSLSLRYQAGGPAKESAVRWLVTSLQLNAEAEKDRPSALLSSSAGFAVNLGAGDLLCCSVLSCHVLSYCALHCIVLSCTNLYWTILHCLMLSCILS